MRKIRGWFRSEVRETWLLLKEVPAVLMTVFTVSVVMMNLLANKSLNLPVSWLALDAGILVSWASFMAMDVLVKTFGPRAATRMTVVVTALNVIVAAVFAVAAHVSGTWGESYCEAQDAINAAIDGTFEGSWYVLLGSTVAFILSSVVNSIVNWAVGCRTNKTGFKAYALRSYVSTAVAQFVDNLVFSLVVSVSFFGWTLVQCLTCAATGAVVELLLEAVFSPIGYAMARSIERGRAERCQQEPNEAGNTIIQ